MTPISRTGREKLASVMEQVMTLPVRPPQRKSLVNRALALHKLFQPEPLASVYDHRYR
jgi:hypothetical protein